MRPIFLVLVLRFREFAQTELSIVNLQLRTRAYQFQLNNVELF